MDSGNPNLLAEIDPTIGSAPASTLSIASKAEDLDAIKKSVEDAASVGAPLWLSYLFLMFYVAIATSAVTQADLLLERPVDLPFLTIKLPLTAFFVVAPGLFLIVHAYTLAHFALLADKAKNYHRQLGRSVTDDVADAHQIREGLRRQLPINIFVQFLAGPEDVRERPFSILLWATAWTTLVAAPVLLMLLIQLQFLPFHDNLTSCWHRTALILDIFVCWWLWMKILGGRSESEPSGSAQRDRWEKFKTAFLWTSRYVFSYFFAGLIIIFSVWIATYPGEWEFLPYSWIKSLEWRSATNAAFGDIASLPAVEPKRWPANTLRLKGFDLYAGLGVDDPKKLDWKKFTADFQNRHLEEADLRLTNFPRVRFSGASLKGANLSEGKFTGGLFTKAELQGADLSGAELHGANFDQALLQGASLVAASLIGSSLQDAHLQGASLGFASAEATDLRSADLRGASFEIAWLIAADLGATKIDGASFRGAHLHGADFGSTTGSAVDFRGAYLWRTQWGSAAGEDKASLKDVRLEEKVNWRPVVKFLDATLVDTGSAPSRITDVLSGPITEVIKEIPDKERRKNIAVQMDYLKCSGNKDAAPCDASARLPPDAVRWKNAVESARAADVASYERSLASIFRTLVCSNDPSSRDILRGLLRGPTIDGKPYNRLSDLGSETKSFISDLLTGKCVTSPPLDDSDRARLQAHL